MRPLSPAARSILSVSEQEPLPSAEMLGRMRQTVLGRVAGAGAILVGSSMSAKAGATLGASVSAKIGAAFGGTLIQVVGSGLVGAFAATAMLTVAHVGSPSPSAVARPTDEAAAQAPKIAPSPAGAGSRPATRIVPEARSQAATRAEPQSRMPIEERLREPRSGTAPEGSSPSRAAPTQAPNASSMEAIAARTGQSPPLHFGTTSPKSSPSTGQHLASAAPSELHTLVQDQSMGAPPAPPDEAQPKNDLSRQLQLLRAVRALLRDQQPARVLELLSHPAHLTEGPFEEELRTARIAALCRLGRQVEAHHEIEAFLQRWPGSPLSGRLRAGCSVQKPE